MKTSLEDPKPITSAAQLINQDSGNVEYYTPANIIEAARRTMGWIDLDPFSCAVANQTIRASSIYTKDDGESTFELEWHGNIWMNHPFSRAMNKRCVDKLIAEYVAGRVKQACCITFASTSEAWFRPLMDYPQCFLSPRTNYLNAEGKKVQGVTKGSVATFIGPDNLLPAFREQFARLGKVKI